MRDCANVGMRDLLPDLLHDRLPSTVRLDVETHLSACEDCRAELALLRQVVAVTIAPRVDASRIASGIPPYQAMSLWRRSVASPLLRVAAAVVLLVGGSAVIVTVANRGKGVSPEPRTAAITSPSTPAVPVATPSTSDVGASVAARRRSSATAMTELAVGEPFHDLSEAELRELLDEVGRLDAVTSSETEIVVPSPSRERGGA